MTRRNDKDGYISYTIFSVGAGIINILSILILTKSLANDSVKLDFLYYILTLLTFLTPVFVAPISAGISRYFKDQIIDKDQETKYLKKLSSGFLTLGIAVVLPVVYLMILWGGVRANYNEDVFGYSMIFSFLVVATIYMELLRIQAIYLNRFRIVSTSLFLMNSLALVCVSLLGTLESFLTVLLLGRIVLCLFYHHQIFNLNIFSISVQDTKDLLSFYSLHTSYSLSNIVTAIANYLPSVILLEMGQGLVSVYYFIQRIVLSPISLIIVPLVDYFRFKVFKDKFLLNTFLKLLALMASFGLIVWFFLVALIDPISVYFFSGAQQNEMFKIMLSFFAPLTLLQAVYVLNTRVSEGFISVNQIALYGLIGHLLFVIALIIGFLLSNWLLIVQARLAIELFVFLPIGVCFVYRSAIKNY